MISALEAPCPQCGALGWIFPCSECGWDRKPPTHNIDGREVVRARFIKGEGGYVDGWIVVCSLLDNPHHPWVTWWLRDSDRVTMQGHYCKTFEEAMADFEKRT
jgi:hypothetical protein